MKRIISALALYAIACIESFAFDVELSTILYNPGMVTNAAVQNIFPGATAETVVDFSTAAKHLSGYVNIEKCIQINRDADGFMEFLDSESSTNKLIRVRKHKLCENAWTNYLEVVYKQDPVAGDAYRAVGAAFDCAMNEWVNYPKQLADIFPKCVRGGKMREWKDTMTKAYLRELKIWFVDNGQSYVEKDGVNPLKSYMDGIVEAMDAPRMSGFEECFVKIGRSDVVLDRSFLPSDDEVQEIVRAVMIDDIGIKSVRGILLVALGVEGYNDVVARYNGEK